MRKVLIVLIVALLPILGSSQIGGNSTFQFLNLPVSARVAAGGGNIYPVWDDDLNLTAQNPSLLNSSMSNVFTLNYVSYISDINYGGFNYARNFDKIGNLSLGLTTIDYGDFNSADETGLITGTFSANETALNLMWSKAIDSLFQFGINIKGISSSLENYQSYGLAADAGVTYHKQNFAASLVMRNLGRQLKTYYTEGNIEPLPFNVQMGFSQKLNHAPFRFSLMIQHLEKFDLSYINPVDQNQIIDPISGEIQNSNKIADFGKKAFNHIILAAEFIPSKNFFVSLAYNAQRRNEMSISTKSGTVGFSWGLGLNISKFKFSFGHARYHLSGASNHFSISTNLSQFYKHQL